METQSQACDTLLLFNGLESFQKNVHKVCSQATKELFIVLMSMDDKLFNDGRIVGSISNMARLHPKGVVRVLILDVNNIRSRRNELINLAQRLPSKIKIRQLTHKPSTGVANIIIADRLGLLFQQNHAVYEGFYNSAAAAEAQNLLEEFNSLWECQSIEIPDLLNLRL